MAIDSYARTLAAAALSNGGSSDYDSLKNKPKINNVTLEGNVSLSDLDVYSKEEIENKMKRLYRYRGSVATKADLDDIDKTTLVEGDVYNVLDSGMNYAWTGTEWDNLGSEIDVSLFANKIIVTPNSDIVIDGNLVPNLNSDDVIKAYNAIVEGNSVIVSTADGSMHFLMSQVMGSDGMIQLMITYKNIMTVVYTLENQQVTITHNNIVTKEYVGDKIIPTIIRDRLYPQTPFQFSEHEKGEYILTNNDSSQDSLYVNWKGEQAQSFITSTIGVLYVLKGKGDEVSDGDVVGVYQDMRGYKIQLEYVASNESYLSSRMLNQTNLLLNNKLFSTKITQRMTAHKIAVITVNANSFTIITAHKIKEASI